MLIIGTMDWTSNVGSASAYCPNCGVQQIFRKKSSRPFLTLYFIPCIPLGRTLEYLQCTGCKGTFGMELLQLTPHINAHLQSKVPGEDELVQTVFEEDLVRAMANIMLEDGGIEPAEILAAQFAFQQLTGQTLSREELGDACDSVSRMKQTTINFLKQSQDRWDDEQRKQVIQAMFWTASATGKLSAERTKALMALGRILNISEEDYMESIATTFEWQEPSRRPPR